MSDLQDFKRKNSRFLTLADGEEIVGKYEGYKITENPFDPDKETVNYFLVMDGEKKVFRSGSNKAAGFFDGVAVGEVVSIKRIGTGRDTKYEYKKSVVTTDPSPALDDEFPDREEKIANEDIDPDDVPF